MTHHSSIAIAAAFTSLVVATGYRWNTALPKAVAPIATATVTTTPRAPLSDSALADAEELLVSNDPFRLANAPSGVRYDPATDGLIATAVAPPRFRPVMTLKAIVGGPPWQAVVDGIPGQPAGTIVRQGATLDKMTVRSVTRDSVVIQGPDTTWVLGFGRRP